MADVRVENIDDRSASSEVLPLDVVELEAALAYSIAATRERDGVNAVLHAEVMYAIITVVESAREAEDPFGRDVVNDTIPAIAAVVHHDQLRSVVAVGVSSWGGDHRGSGSCCCLHEGSD